MGRFKCKKTEALHRGEPVLDFQGVAKVALRRLDLVLHVARLQDLMVPPGNRFEKLKGKRDGQYSIRINDQWRICFVWRGQAEEIEITDYH